MKLAALVAKLKSRYGAPAAPPVRADDPWEWIVWENVVYLANDDARSRAFADLKKRVGLRPKDILAAPRGALAGVSSGRGILAEDCAEKLRDAAAVAMEDWDGDLRPILKLSRAKAVKALKRFPGIGEPGAEKILMFARALSVLALESNGLRVLVRAGLGEELPAYAATYKSVRKAVEAEGAREVAWVVEAHQLLRRHGQETCRRSEPLCAECPVVRECPHYAAHGRRL